ncbi:hypothetical protein BDR26DRAFT_853697 [Obelidium mucronatum]|nr:hypothetical protein BDR26DRAFT_853697 [Obelidium mucronatum]
MPLHLVALVALCGMQAVMARSVLEYASSCSPTGKGWQCGNPLLTCKDGYCVMLPAIVEPTTPRGPSFSSTCSNFASPCLDQGTPATLMCVKNPADGIGRCIASGTGIASIDQRCDNVENVCQKGLQCIAGVCRGKVVETGSICNSTVAGILTVCKTTDICLVAAGTTTSPTLGSDPTPTYAKCAPMPPKVPQSRSCIPDPSGICLGLGFCFVEKTSVEVLYYCDGNLIQTNNELNVTGNINVRTSNFTVPTVSTGIVCDKFPEGIGRCGTDDICLYPPAPANQTAPAVCTKRPVNLPPKVTSTNSSNPSCIPDSSTRETCSGLWICFIGNNGFESVYYCDGQIDYSKGSPNFIAWHNPFGAVFGVSNTSTTIESSTNSDGSRTSNTGMIAGIAVGALVIIGLVIGGVLYSKKKRSSLNNSVSAAATVGDEKPFDSSMSPTYAATTTATSALGTSQDSIPLPPSESVVVKPRFEKPKEVARNVQSVPGFYRTLEEFKSDNEDELSYPKDARVYVTSKPDAEGWCHALISGSYGLVHDSKMGPIG